MATFWYHKIKKDLTSQLYTIFGKSPERNIDLRNNVCYRKTHQFKFKFYSKNHVLNVKFGPKFHFFANTFCDKKNIAGSSKNTHKFKMQILYIQLKIILFALGALSTNIIRQGLNL